MRHDLTPAHRSGEPDFWQQFYCCLTAGPDPILVVLARPAPFGGFYVDDRGQWLAGRVDLSEHVGSHLRGPAGRGRDRSRRSRDNIPTNGRGGGCPCTTASRCGSTPSV